MSDKHHNERGDEHPVLDDLVAYLDGELNEAGSRRIEQRLSGDGEFRQRLHQHQQAWDMLDELPQTQPGDQFTQTTLELITVSASKEVRRARLPLGIRWSWIGAGLGAAIFTLVGYLTVAMLVSAPNRQLVKDLPLIEHLDAYRHAESLEFLRALDENGLFEVEDDEDAL